MAKNRPSRIAQVNSVSGQSVLPVQKKSTPRRKPRNRGGSPSGVRDPPMFDTSMMKKTKTWTLCTRSSLARRSGRIRIIDAPVVPMTLAGSAPIARMAVFMPGEPWMLPATTIPPAAVKSANSMRMKGRYSVRSVCGSAAPVASTPCVAPAGSRREGPAGGDLAVVPVPDMGERAADRARSRAGCRRRARPTRSRDASPGGLRRPRPGRRRGRARTARRREGAPWSSWFRAAGIRRPYNPNPE